MPKSSILNHVNRIFHDKPSNLRGSPFMEKKTCEGFYIFFESTVQKAHWIDIVLRSRKRYSKNRFPTFFCPQQILGRVETLILRAIISHTCFLPIHLGYCLLHRSVLCQSCPVHYGNLIIGGTWALSPPRKNTICRYEIAYLYFMVFVHHLLQSSSSPSSLSSSSSSS